MIIGIPKEIKVMEGRVALIPAAAAELVQAGHRVVVQAGAGELSGYSDQQYWQSGLEVLPDAASVYQQAQLLVKVKEPLAEETARLRADQMLFSYLHLAALPQLTRQLQQTGVTAIAFETVTDDAGRLPLLAPMSDIAGRLSVQAGCHYLHAPLGGKGILLGGLPAAPRGQVVVVGAGVAGSAAVAMAAAMGANVMVFDLNRSRLEAMRALGNNVTALYPYQEQIQQAVATADLLIGAVLVPGARAPHLVSEVMVQQMQPGSVIVDISVDQGGCIETIRPTDYLQPVYLQHEVVHFGVANMPGAVPRTASQALSAAITPYVQLLASGNWQQHAGLAQGINVQAGDIVHPAVRQALS